MNSGQRNVVPVEWTFDPNFEAYRNAIVMLAMGPDAPAQLRGFEAVNNGRITLTGDMAADVDSVRKATNDTPASD